MCYDLNLVNYHRRMIYEGLTHLQILQPEDNFIICYKGKIKLIFPHP